MTDSANNTVSDYPPAGLIRRLAAAAYDLLLLTALLFVIGMLAVALNAGQAINISAGIPLIGFVFFGYFWTRGGQTLGMRAWRIALITPEGTPITWRQALYRYLGAGLSLLAGGLGFFWSWIDPHQATWHDKLSGSRMIHTPEPADASKTKPPSA